MQRKEMLLLFDEEVQFYETGLLHKERMID